MVPGFKAERIRGVVFGCFDNDPLLDRSMDTDSEIPGVLRFLAQNFTEIVTHLVV